MDGYLLGSERTGNFEWWYFDCRDPANKCTLKIVIHLGSDPLRKSFFPTLALVQQGDEVIYPDPGFPTYEAMIKVAGGVPVPIPLLEEEDFSFNLDAFDQLVNERTKLVILNSPSNPTGGVMQAYALEYIANAAQKYDFWVLSDEVYSRLTFDLPALSIATFSNMEQRTIICDGFSKTYAMTGWRLGYGIMPESLADRVEMLLIHSVGCTAGFTQVAGMEAIHGPQDQVEAVVDQYKRKRNVLVDGLNSIQGIHCRMPQGAIYAFPNVSAFGKKCDWLADYLLDQAGVAVLPGTSFGKNGEGYLRLSFANSMGNIETALDKMSAAFAKLN